MARTRILCALKASHRLHEILTASKQVERVGVKELGELHLDTLTFIPVLTRNGICTKDAQYRLRNKKQREEWWKGGKKEEDRK